ncbi:hypothetical protein DH2020_049302 [Rehmannia glutinosa]|uniref:Uncharacterized protein n=1 Tax=Rehmannia glutinosa TaxID=99300 RepID=A0ABR0U3G6_REHGL
MGRGAQIRSVSTFDYTAAAAVINWLLRYYLSCASISFDLCIEKGLLEMQIYRLKNELENVLWDRKELEEKLHVAIKERKMMEMMLMELEEEHDEAIVKIELLEGEVQDLKDEMQRLKEIQGKALWSYTNRGDVIDDCNFRQVSKDIIKDEMNDPVKNVSKIYGLSQPYVTYTISDEGYNLAEHRDVALSRTLFSAILSLAVGLVVWEADDPCMPLVVALFTVVTMSLTSVLRLFTRIEHKLRLEVVTLLSLHWFVLGTLACLYLLSFPLHDYNPKLKNCGFQFEKEEDRLLPHNPVPFSYTGAKKNSGRATGNLVEFHSVDSSFGGRSNNVDTNIVSLLRHCTEGANFMDES